VIVVDTNVIAYLWLPGPNASVAEHMLRRDPEWCAPLLWRSEFRSVLTGLVRRKDLSIDSAVRTAAGAEHQLRGREYAVPSERVLRAAATSGCSPYDCEYVVLAEELGILLVTADKQVLEAFPDFSRSLKAAAEEL
jgi:predicted nucleic acid-binding protein